jgi:hypothetical protein
MVQGVVVQIANAESARCAESVDGTCKNKKNINEGFVQGD